MENILLHVNDESKLIKYKQTTPPNNHLPHPPPKEQKQTEKKEEQKKRKRKWQKQFLTKRDLLLMRFCYEQYFLVREQFIKWLLEKHDFRDHFSTDPTMRRIIDLYKRLEVIKAVRSGFFDDYREIYVITEKGIATLKDKGLLPEYATNIELDEQKLKHDYMVTEVRLALEKVILHKSWVSDRFLRTENNQNIPDAEFSFFSQKAGRDLKISIEVEMTQKSRDRYIKRLSEHKKSHYDLLFYIVDQESIKRAVLEASKGVTRTVFVCLVDELLKKQQDTVLVSNDEKFILGEKFVTRQMPLKGGGL